MDVFNQRLQDEFDTPVIITSPMVPYRVVRLPGNPLARDQLSLSLIGIDEWRRNHSGEAW